LVADATAPFLQLQKRGQFPHAGDGERFTTATKGRKRSIRKLLERLDILCWIHSPDVGGGRAMLPKKQLTADRGAGDLRPPDHPVGFSTSAESSAMSRLLGVVAAGEKSIIPAVDWTGIRCVVDVGGGRGILLSALLQSRPELAGILFDQPDVVRGADEYLGEFVTAGRCRIVAGDFLHFVPPGGDAYILKNVLRNWDDSRCLDILCNCRCAMSAGGRLLIIERTTDRGNALSGGRTNDAGLLTATKVYERTRDDFPELLAHVGLHVSRVSSTPAGWDILEAIAD
jgi:O-methyltransferase domain